MRVDLPEIYWHGDRERIMSVDFLSKENLLITGGADLQQGVYMRLWKLRFEGDSVIPEHVDDLVYGHERSVNVVRSSPTGEFIASGSDDCCVVIWGKKLKPIWGEDSSEIGWGSIRVLRGHIREIHDLCWNEDGTMLATASMDGSCIIFDAQSAKLVQRIEGNNYHLQGVAWKENYIVTLSSDRTLRIYQKGKKSWYIMNSIKEFDRKKLFQDEYSASAYFRRLAFSPDGKMLLSPSGLVNETPVVHCFLAKIWAEPIISYPINMPNEDKPTAIGVRMCPYLFRAGESSAVSGLDYKVVWAVITRESVLIYNNEKLTPVACVSNFHFSSLCDIAWTGDRLLAVCSTDGYVSFIVFEEGELGERINNQ